MILRSYRKLLLVYLAPLQLHRIVPLRADLGR